MDRFQEKIKYLEVLRREMFLPMQETEHWFFGYHFGIMGVDETMKFFRTISAI